MSFQLGRPLAFDNFIEKNGIWWKPIDGNKAFDLDNKVCRHNGVWWYPVKEDKKEIPPSKSEDDGDSDEDWGKDWEQDSEQDSEQDWEKDWGQDSEQDFEENFIDYTSRLVYVTNPLLTYKPKTSFWRRSVLKIHPRRLVENYLKKV
jgi:hypothetical protein